MVELRLGLLWGLEVGVLISPRSLVGVFGSAAAAAAVLNCSQTPHVEFSGSESAVGKPLAQAGQPLHIQ